jgi:hypothetical protein
MEWLLTYGDVPHEVPRSACVFCPYHSDHEWKRIKAEDPEGWARAVQIDEGLRKPGVVVNRKLDAKMYLHRSLMPLSEITWPADTSPRDRQLSINFSAECMGVCGV